MHVVPELLQALGAEGAITEGGAFGGTGDDADVLGPGHSQLSDPRVLAATRAALIDRRSFSRCIYKESLHS
jgi:hypothetical protein